MYKDQLNQFLFVAEQIAKTVKEKNEQYGNSFEKSGEILKILYPNGIDENQYGEMLTVTRIIDKLFRIATKYKSDHEDPWNDICGYSLLECEKRSRSENK